MYGLKAQKLLAQGSGRKQHVLKGQKLCPGQRPGYNGNRQGALQGQKPYKLLGVLKLLPLQGDRFAAVITQGAALG